MDDQNFTHVTEFILLGVTDLQGLNPILFIILLTFFLLNVAGNMSIMTVVISYSPIHTPMYFFLLNLSILDIGISSTVVPKSLANLLLRNKTISYEGCLTQLHFWHFFGGTEAVLLAFMSCDRYVAICHPLRYVVIMNGHVCIFMASCSWTVGFIHSLFHTILTSRLPFCASNKVRHFFCDFQPLFKVACANTYFNEHLMTITIGSITISTFLLIIISYVFIGTHLLKIKSSQGRIKAFSTCASHLIIVILYIGTVIFTYSRATVVDSIEQERLGSILFTVVSPTLNPFIYTLRNKEVRRGLRKVFFGNTG